MRRSRSRRGVRARITVRSKCARSLTCNCSCLPVENLWKGGQSPFETVYRRESRRVFATLIRLLGDFDLAEEALHDAFISAMEKWPSEDIPDNPRAWLVQAGRFKGLDTIRRRVRFDASLGEIAERLNAESPSALDQINEGIEDDRLRLIFTCCHPALAPEARSALTLREV